MEGNPTLSSPEEELAYLREQVARQEAELASHDELDQVRIISEEIHEHHAASDEMLAPEYRISEETKANEAEALIEELKLGGSESAVRSLASTMESKGIKNALSILEKTGDAHLVDDFHRYLVRYIAAGLSMLGMNEKAPRFKALHMTLYEIALPEPKGEDKQSSRTKTLKELVSSMEQFYSGLLSVEHADPGEPAYFALELAVPADSPELQFFTVWHLDVAL